MPGRSCRAKPARAWLGALNKIGKFSMLDIFLIAVTIVGLKGVGLGKVEIAYGLYAFAAVVLMILAFVISGPMRCQLPKLSLG